MLAIEKDAWGRAANALPAGRQVLAGKKIMARRIMKRRFIEGQTRGGIVNLFFRIGSIRHAKIKIAAATSAEARQ